MKIYFSASIHGSHQYGQNYQQIADLVRKAGHTFIDKHTIGVKHEDVQQYSEQDHLEFYKDVHAHLKRADAFFCELSYTSTSTGFMIATAVNMGKPVVIFYSGKEEPHLFQTLEKVSDRVAVVRYQHLDDLDKEVPRMLDFVNESQDVRFNFFISSRHSNYLDWISKTRKIPRSVYLRRLIDDHMRHHDQDEFVQ